MKLKTLALCTALAVCAPLASGCSTISAVIHGAQAPANSTLDEKAMILAETAFDGATLSVEQANSAGLLSPSNKTLAASYLTQAHSVLLLARTAYDAGNASDLTTQISKFADLISQIKALIPAKG